MKAVVLFAIVGAIWPANLHAAAPTACPLRHGGAPLARVTIFDGPLSDSASLAPDTTRVAKGVTIQQWSVAYVYEAGRKINLSCEYRSKRKITVAVAKPARFCRYVWGRTTVRALCT